MLLSLEACVNLGICKVGGIWPTGSVPSLREVRTERFAGAKANTFGVIAHLLSSTQADY